MESTVQKKNVFIIYEIWHPIFAMNIRINHSNSAAQ